MEGERRRPWKLDKTRVQGHVCSVSAYGFLTSNGQKCWCGKVVGGVCLLMDDLSK